MSRYIRRSELLGFKKGRTDQKLRYLNEQRSFSKSLKDIKTVFLSHSHKDKELVEAAIAFFLESDIFIYVDWLDHSMPAITSSKTAELIKAKIEEADFFVVLASPNAKNSRWVPWELGFADKTKGVEKIFILPVAEDNDFWDGAEYLDLYQKIQTQAPSFGRVGEYDFILS